MLNEDEQWDNQDARRVVWLRGELKGMSLLVRA